MVKKVNYSSADSLREVFADQDAVVSTIATLAIGSQTLIVDAAHDAGVKRFIPSEFGINTRALGIPGLEVILSGKIKTIDYLQEKADQNPDFTWTGLSTGLFLDWVGGTRQTADPGSVTDLACISRASRKDS